jgi:hypothetical protein
VAHQAFTAVARDYKGYRTRRGLGLPPFVRRQFAKVFELNKLEFLNNDHEYQHGQVYKGSTWNLTLPHRHGIMPMVLQAPWVQNYRGDAHVMITIDGSPGTPSPHKRVASKIFRRLSNFATKHGLRVVADPDVMPVNKIKALVRVQMMNDEIEHKVNEFMRAEEQSLDA